jgi:P27 family predicted phage terminase small subunit
MEMKQFPSSKAPPQPPDHLKEAGRRFWLDIVLEYHVRDGAGLALVTTASVALDRMTEARESITKHGLITTDRYGNPKANPAVHIERDARAGFLAALKALNLDIEPLRDRGRPPSYA